MTVCPRTTRFVGRRPLGGAALIVCVGMFNGGGQSVQALMIRIH